MKKCGNGEIVMNRRLLAEARELWLLSSNRKDTFLGQRSFPVLNMGRICFILFLMTSLFAILPDSAWSQWETEPNNTFETANPFPLDGVEFGGQLSSSTDIDVYKFNVSTPGLLTFTARFENSNYDGGSIYVSIEDASANVLSGRKLSSSEAEITLNGNASTAGTYYVVVEKNEGYTITSKNYLIAGSISTEASAINHWEKEPNDTNVLSSYYALDGVEFGGQLSSSTDIDVYKFNMSTPGLLTFTARFENSNYDGGSIYVSIEDASANVLSGRKLSSSEAEITQNGNASTAGTYYVVVEKNEGYTITSKNYLIAGSISTEASAINHWEKEPNDTNVLSSYYALDGIEFGGQLSFSTDIDVYKFNVTTPGLLTFTAQFENSNYDGGSIYVSIKDASANVLSGKKLSSSEAAITLNGNASTAGTYYVVVEKNEGYTITSKNYLIAGSGASFNQYKVTANATGTGAGTVTSSPAGISYSYNSKATGNALFSTPLVLIATAKAGSTVSWTTCIGTKSGNGTGKATCTYSSLDGNKTAVVKFNSKPTIVSLNPATLTSSVGIAQILTAVYRDKDGSTDLKYAEILVNKTLSVSDGIRVRYDKSTNKLLLYNNAGTVSTGNCTPGVAGTLQNTQGRINCAKTKVSTTATDLTVKWTIIPQTGFTGGKNIYLKATDKANAAIDWKKKSIWTIGSGTSALSAEGVNQQEGSD